MTPRAFYSIGDLAAAAGVSRRTLHFYVQRGLLPPPEGRGRGARYTDEHLARLLRIKGWQEQGRLLDEIHERLAGTGEDEPGPGGTWLVRPALPRPSRLAPQRRALPDSALPPAPAPGQAQDTPGTAWFRQPLIAGFELHVSGDRRPLTARELARLARSLGEILDNGGNEK